MRYLNEVLNEVETLCETIQYYEEILESFVVDNNNTNSSDVVETNTVTGKRPFGEFETEPYRLDLYSKLIQEDTNIGQKITRIKTLAQKIREQCMPPLIIVVCLFEYQSISQKVTNLNNPPSTPIPLVQKYGAVCYDLIATSNIQISSNEPSIFAYTSQIYHYLSGVYLQEINGDVNPLQKSTQLFAIPMDFVYTESQSIHETKKSKREISSPSVSISITPNYTSIFDVIIKVYTEFQNNSDTNNPQYIKILCELCVLCYYFVNISQEEITESHIKQGSETINQFKPNNTTNTPAPSNLGVISNKNWVGTDSILTMEPTGSPTTPTTPTTSTIAKKVWKILLANIKQSYSSEHYNSLDFVMEYQKAIFQNIHILFTLIYQKRTNEGITIRYLNSLWNITGGKYPTSGQTRKRTNPSRKNNVDKPSGKNRPNRTNRKIRAIAIRKYTRRRNGVHKSISKRRQS